MSKREPTEIGWAVRALHRAEEERLRRLLVPSGRREPESAVPPKDGLLAPWESEWSPMPWAVARLGLSTRHAQTARGVERTSPTHLEARQHSRPLPAPRPGHTGPGATSEVGAGRLRVQLPTKVGGDRH